MQGTNNGTVLNIWEINIFVDKTGQVLKKYL
jgi:hypothetical protein